MRSAPWFNRLSSLWILGLFSITFLSCHPGSQGTDGCGHDERAFRCVKYLRNYDADTITFEINGVHPLLGREIPIRVLGVDTAEIKGKNDCEKAAAQRAKAFVTEQLKKAKRIDLENIGRDKYFRIDADVKVDGQSLGKMLIQAGLATPYDGGTKANVNWCQVPH